jgi:hypothetical protein
VTEQWTFEIREALPDDWASVPTVAIGGSTGPADLFVLAEEGTARRRFDLHYLETDYRHPPQATFWRGWFAFGFGGRAILYREADGASVKIDLGCYFGDFLTGEEWLLVTSGQGIIRLDPEGRIVWRNDELGLDGVLIFDVEGDVIDGQGEWDPPGGWEDFLVSLETGDSLEELPDDETPDA